VRYTIKHTIETDIDTFWNKVIFEPEFNRKLFVEFLGFTTYNLLEDRTDPDGVRHRRVDAVPKIELPAAARKVLGDNIGFVEVGRYDPAVKRYYVQVLPKAGGDKIKTTTEIWAEPLGNPGDKRIERIVSVDNSVKIFGIGTLVEGFIEQQTRDSYARAAEYTNRYIRENGL
jgi:hypothetical protein